MAAEYKPFTAEETARIEADVFWGDEESVVATADVRALLAMARRALELESELAATKAELVDAKDRLTTVIDESFGLQPVAESWGALLSSLERLLFERDQQELKALRERDEARAELAKRDALHAHWHTCAVCACSLHEDTSVPFCEDCVSPQAEDEEAWTEELNRLMATDTAPKESE